MGWLLNGSKGALIAGVLFILPGMVALLALSGIYVASGDTTLVEASFLGLAPAVVAIVLQAVIRVARKGHGHLALIAVAVGSFIGLTFFAGSLHTERPSGRRSTTILIGGLIHWFAPMALAALAFGRSSIFVVRRRPGADGRRLLDVLPRTDG